MSTNPNKSWLCNNCNTRCKSEFDALYCCQPSITSGYICPTCKTLYIEEDQAIACCQVEPEDSPTPTAQELEAAGQERLLP